MEKESIFTSIENGASKCINDISEEFERAHSIKNAAPLLEEAVENLMKKYQDEGYLVQQLNFVEKDKNGVLVQIGNESSALGNVVKSVTGLRLAVCVKFINDDEGNLNFTICKGKWLDKAMVNVVSWFVLQPLFVTSIIGLWRQKSLIDGVERDLLSYFANHYAHNEWVCEF